MSSLRITIGNFKPHDEASFPSALRMFLESHGELSEVEGRGLNIIPVRHNSVAGSLQIRVMAAIIAKPGSSNRKLYNALVDLSKEQIDRTLIRFRRGKEIEVESRKYNGHTIYSYFITDKGYEEHDRRLEDYKRGLQPAIDIYRKLAAMGMTKGQAVDPSAVRKAMGKAIESTDFWAGWRRLQASNKIDTAWNARGPGRHEYFIAR